MPMSPELLPNNLFFIMTTRSEDLDLRVERSPTFLRVKMHSMTDVLCARCVLVAIKRNCILLTLFTPRKCQMKLNEYRTNANAEATPGMADISAVLGYGKLHYGISQALESKRGISLSVY